jgi:hypothetical protein
VRVTGSTQTQSALRRIAVASRNVVFFFVGLFGFGAIQTHDVAVPDSGTLGRKWRHFEEKGDRYSLVFVGSSRVAHHFIPEQFDASMKAAGIEMKSFNFGQDGMFPPESFYVLRKLLEQSPAKPRFVLIDLMNFRPILKGNEEAARAVAWHDWRHTLLACGVLLSSDYEKPDGEPGVLYHLRLLAKRTLGEGRWQEHLRARMKIGVRPSTPVTLEGYEPLESKPLAASEAARFRGLSEAMKGTQKQATMPAEYRRALESLIAFVRARGAEPVFVVAPDIYASQRFENWPPAGVTQFSYDRPETYPTLYREDQRYDASHLDAEGAKEFTRIFAVEFADWMKRKP